MQQQALIVWGGWLGHEPEQTADIFRGVLEAEGFAVEVATTLDRFVDAMADILAEAQVDPERCKQAPVTMPVRRLDEVRAARKPDLRYRP